MQPPAAAPLNHSILCVRCERPLAVRAAWVGREAACPHCGSVMCVTPAVGGGLVDRAGHADLRPRMEFHFPCPRCETLLEAHTGMSQLPATCPACATRMIVPGVLPSGLPQPAGLCGGDDPAATPQPVHAFAADGASAPTIIDFEGRRMIRCGYCKSTSEIDADRCGQCRRPFTADATQTGQQIRTDRLAQASIILGCVAVPFFALFVPALLAAALGGWSLIVGGRRIRALVGTLLGMCSLLGGVLYWAL
jgi:DNA-directed RNA polymerase subunit RPC12/RpoP